MVVVAATHVDETLFEEEAEGGGLKDSPLLLQDSLLIIMLMSDPRLSLFISPLPTAVSVQEGSCQ